MKHIDNIAKLFSKNFVENPLIESFEVGEIYISSGKLLACDPLLTNDMPSFATQFPKGNFKVIIHYEKDTHHIAYIEIVFSENNCSSWEMATTPNQEISLLKKNEIYGFPVASGMASIMDLETQTLLNELENKLYLEKGDDFLGIYQEFFHDAFFVGNDLQKNYAFLVPNNNFKNSIFAFDTGENEGFYASYIGFDELGEPCKIIMEIIEIGHE
jgi:hypothetical protein